MKTDANRLERYAYHAAHQMGFSKKYDIIEFDIAETMFKKGYKYAERKAMREIFHLEMEIDKLKQLMISKACDWIINTYLGDYITDEHGNGGIGDNVKLAEDLRKAMEG